MKRNGFRMKRVSYVSDFMDFVYTFYFYVFSLLLLLLFSLSHLVRFIVLPFIKWKETRNSIPQSDGDNNRTDLSMNIKKEWNSTSSRCFHFNRFTFLHAHWKRSLALALYLKLSTVHSVSAIVSIYRIWMAHITISKRNDEKEWERNKNKWWKLLVSNDLCFIAQYLKATRKGEKNIHL